MPGTLDRKDCTRLHTLLGLRSLQVPAWKQTHDKYLPGTVFLQRLRKSNYFVLGLHEQARHRICNILHYKLSCPPGRRFLVHLILFPLEKPPRVECPCLEDLCIATGERLTLGRHATRAVSRPPGICLCFVYTLYMYIIHKYTYTYIYI